MTKIKLSIWALTLVFLAILSQNTRASGTYYRPGSSASGKYSSLKKGELRAGVRADFQRYSQERLFNGIHARVAEVRLRTYTLFTEYGLTQNSSAYVAIPYVDNDSDAKNSPAYAPEQGLGDMKIGYNKFFPLRNNTVLIGTGEATVPLRNYKTTKLTAYGENSVDFLTHFALKGDSVAGTPLFYSIGAGGKLRASKAPDQLLWDAELGGRLGSSASLSTFLDSIDSAHGTTLGGPSFNGDYAQLKQALTRWGFRAQFNLGTVGGEIYYAKAIRYQNQSPSDYYGLSILGRF